MFLRRAVRDVPTGCQLSTSEVVGGRLSTGSPLALREDFADAADFCANAFQLLLDMFVAAVDVVDAVDDGLAVGDQGGQHQGRGSAQVGREHGGCAKGSFAPHDGATAFNAD